jgi:hypothetical protein
MRAFKYVCIALVVLMLAGSVLPVQAQSYSFQVPTEFVLVTINPDGTITLDYTITFQNDTGALAIDAVDIGVPTTDYSIRNISAAIDGKAITRIEDSPYVNGIALYLQGNEIPAGGTGTVSIHIPNVGNVLYEATATESEPYASLEFSPNWFDSSFCHGSTQLQVTYLFPSGITDQEPRYFPPSSNWNGPQEPEKGFTADTNILFYTWVSDSANAYTQYTFGASFPMRLVDSNAIVTGAYVPPPDNTATDTGGGITFNTGNLCGWVFCLGLIGFFGVIIYSATVGAKKRKLQYLPPKISIEGHGIKRGLTAVEAGILMEQPMDKILTMTLFALLKKEAAEVTVKEPLTIKAASPLPADLYGYETDFLTAFQEVDTEKRKKLLQVMMVNLIRGVGEKMKGFSKKETVAFYEDIMRRAWEQVEAAATPEVKGQVYQEVIDWTMLDKNYDDRTRQTFSSPVFIPTPTWWWRYDPTFARTSTIGTSTAGSSSMPSLGGGRNVSLPSLPGSAFAASVVNGVQNFSSNVLGNVAGFTSGITNVTNPVPPPSTYRSSGGGGGHSCACACACAGCACACAGGGR